MPKRKHSDGDYDYIRRKIKKLERKLQRALQGKRRNSSSSGDNAPALETHQGSTSSSQAAEANIAHEKPPAYQSARAAHEHVEVVAIASEVDAPLLNPVRYAGQLSLFLKQWSLITDDQIILSWIEGYQPNCRHRLCNNTLLPLRFIRIRKRDTSMKLEVTFCILELFKTVNRVTVYFYLEVSLPKKRDYVFKKKLIIS